MALYLIGIGGTGAKCIEAVIQMAAVGLFTEDSIKILFIDADEANGNLERARSSLSIYQKTFGLFGVEKQDLSWMKTPIKSFGLWSPFANKNTNKNLGAFFNYNNLKQNYQALGNLFDVLYTQEERSVDLDVGFRGRPAIGSAIMSQVDLDTLDEEPWLSLLAEIQNSAGSGTQTKILLCGSIFGGTGASGLPTIGRLLANKLTKLSGRERVKLGCLFALPYFGFTPRQGENPDAVYARADLFLLNTEAALRFYVTQAKQTFDTVYLLGNQNLTSVEFSIGKNTQRNDPHFIELYAALAARHFLLQQQAERGAVVLIGRQDLGTISWDDLPEGATVKTELVNATRFAYAWLADTVPELEQAKRKGVDWAQQNLVWFSKFYRPNQGVLNRLFGSKGVDLPDLTLESEQEAIRTFSSWCQDYLRWLHGIHKCESDSIKLFTHRDFSPDAPLKKEVFSTLIIDDSRDDTRKRSDNLLDLHLQLMSNTANLTPPIHGTVGLAKSLYKICRL